MRNNFISKRFNNESDDGILDYVGQIYGVNYI